MGSKFEKQKRAIDYLPENPMQAIEEVWYHQDVDYVLAELPYWLYMACSHEGATYNDEVEIRARLITFYVDLLPFVEAMYFLYKISNAWKEEDEKYPLAPRVRYILSDNYRSQYLNKKNAANPILVVKEFCNTFPLPYVRIELWDFFQSVQYYKGPLKEHIYQFNTHNFYLNLLTLVEAGHILSKK